MMTGNNSVRHWEEGREEGREGGKEKEGGVPRRHISL